MNQRNNYDTKMLRLYIQTLCTRLVRGTCVETATIKEITFLVNQLTEHSTQRTASSVTKSMFSLGEWGNGLLHTFPIYIKGTNDFYVHLQFPQLALVISAGSTVGFVS